MALGRHKDISTADVIGQLKSEVFDRGRSVVPLLGAGISSEAGVPRLAEVTEYLAKTKGYIRHHVYAKLNSDTPVRWDEGDWRLALELPSFSTSPRDYLRQFGWPDPEELNSDLKHWIERRKQVRPEVYPTSIRQIIVGEILDSVAAIDRQLVKTLLKYRKGVSPKIVLERLDDLNDVGGRFWKILLTEMTRSSEDLIDTLFQRLTHKRYPATSHRFLALLTPILRLKLFLTTNFDRLLEDAFRAEGHDPTVFEVADGLNLPHPKLMRSGLSIIKLHGGAYGLLVGDRLDSPLDEETRQRFRAYLPERPILMVLGFGGEDQRVLDMLELVHECRGDVYWLYFQNYRPHLLIDRFSQSHGELPDWIRVCSLKDPGAFLRQFYSELTHTHPSSSLPFKFSHLPPVLSTPVPDASAFPGTPVAVFQESTPGGQMSTARDLAEFVATKRASHQPIWIDVETKFTLESLVTDIIQQLRRFDPGLPPELIAFERLTSQGLDTDDLSTTASRRGHQKIVRRLYAAMARGRYLLALNGATSFGSQPTRHHGKARGDSDGKPGKLSREQESLLAFIRVLIEWRERMPADDQNSEPEGSATGGRAIECLGLQDSILALTLDQPGTVEGQQMRGRLEEILVDVPAECWHHRGEEEAKAESASSPGIPKMPAVDPWKDPCLILITACRRRRNSSALSNLIPKYLRLSSPGADVGRDAVRTKLQRLAELKLITFLESGDAWMGRRLRNDIYDSIRKEAMKSGGARAVKAAATLAFVHMDLATYFYREIYTGSQDAEALFEAFYHRWAYLKYLQALQTKRKAKTKAASIEWVERLQSHPADLGDSRAGEASKDGDYWMGSHSIIKDQRLDGKAVACRRLRGLRAMLDILEQEREVLLRRVSAAALEAWLHSIRREAPEITGTQKVDPEIAPEIDTLRGHLLVFLDDLEVALHSDRLESHLIIQRRHAQTCRILEKSPQDQEDTLWLLDERVEPTQEDLKAFFREGLDEGADAAYSLNRRKSRVFRAILDVLWAYGRCRWLVPTEYRKKQRLRELPSQLLELWRLHAKEPIPSNLMLESRILFEILKADDALWGVSPWDAKGRSLALLRKYQNSAGEALRGCERGLRLLDDTREDDRAKRSYLHSLKGRAGYLRNEFDLAYRQFDRARAVLQEHLIVHREPLAVALLRQAESLMLHADYELTTWAIHRLEELLESVRSDSASEAEPNWRLFLSQEGRRKLGGKKTLAGGRRDSPDEKARALLKLSLANHAPEALIVLENLTHTEFFESHEVPLSILRSRLDSAREVLDRAERALEGGRRNVQWWGCLFQLRAQLAIEQLLLLLSGDFSSFNPTPVEARSSSPGHPKVGEEVSKWLGQQQIILSGGDETMNPRDPGPGLKVPRKLADRGRFGVVDPLRVSETARKRFINRFRTLVRQGLVAVRQGLDILLPGPADREKPRRLREDVLIRRLLRLWAELLVCGASAHAAGERSNPDRAVDFKVRKRHQKETMRVQWEEWLFLNQVSGLVHLPAPDRLLQHFEHLYGFGAQPPGLSARAQTLAKIDYLLSRNHDLPGVLAILEDVLVRDSTQGEQATS